jgi:1-deoxy-D-xylulose-5-phosphate reductoisomerase
MRIGLANKETLVAAGEWVTPLVRQHNVELIPVDSEHSAIFQCLEASRAVPGPGAPGPGVPGRDAGAAGLGDEPARGVKRIVLTASGGPFREASKQQIENATVAEALNHPTWNMGPKITIDSATMMNKALEIIEAHWLFGLPSEQIEVIVHPQSIVHSFVEFEDNSVLAQLGPPDMRTPIQYALTWPDRPTGCSRALDWPTLSKLDFEPPDLARFPALRLAYDVVDAGGTAGATFNAANEAAVAAFLDGRIRFGRIVELVAEALAAFPAVPVQSLDCVYDADRQARQYVAGKITTKPQWATDEHR